MFSCVKMALWKFERGFNSPKKPIVLSLERLDILNMLSALGSMSSVSMV